MTPTQSANPVEAMHKRMLRLHLDLSEEGAARLPALDETFEAFGVTLEELRVAEENLLQTNEVLLTTRQQLDSERRRYRELFDLAPDAYLVTDPAGVILDANRAAASLLNVPQRLMPGKILPNFVPESDRRAFRVALVDVAGNPASAPWRIPLKPRHREAVEVEVSVSAGTNSARNGRELLWLLRDLTGRHRPFSPPREADESVTPVVVERDRLRDLIDTIGVVVWEADPVGNRLTLVGREIEGLLGRPAAHWLDVPGGWIDRIHPDDRHVVASLRARQRVERTDLVLEYRLLVSEGHVVWVREVSRYTPGRDGDPESLRGVLININSRKRVERGLRYAQADAERLVADLELLQDLCERLSLANDLPAALDEALWAVLSVLGADIGSIALRDARSAEVRVAAGVGLPDSFLNALSERRPGIDPGSAALAGRKSVAFEDVETDTDTAESREVWRQAGIRAVFATPLFNFTGEALGAVTVYFASPHRPSQRQQSLVERFTRQAGQQIANVRRHAAELDALRSSLAGRPEPSPSEELGW